MIAKRGSLLRLSQFAFVRERRLLVFLFMISDIMVFNRLFRSIPLSRYHEGGRRRGGPVFAHCGRVAGGKHWLMKKLNNIARQETLILS
jgi:hypothetical protein